MSIVRGQNIVNDPLSLNLYSYCQNNPIRYRDSSGNMAAEITIAATNLWNPVGWVAASVLAVEIGIVAGVAIYAAIQTARAHKLLQKLFKTKTVRVLM